MLRRAHPAPHQQSVVVAVAVGGSLAGHRRGGLSTRCGPESLKAVRWSMNPSWSQFAPEIRNVATGQHVEPEVTTAVAVAYFGATRSPDPYTTLLDATLDE